MRNVYRLLIIFIFTGVITISARPWRPGQIPNGSKFSCANCHVDPAGGGPRNLFGQEVEKRVSVGGTEEFWNASLATLDSDKDGKSNGSELGDPNGVWRPGQSDPGNFNLITNPGNSSSVGVERNTSGIANTYVLYNNYPNPFNPTTSIVYNLPKSSRVSLYVYNMLGQVVARLVDNQFMPAGLNRAQFNAADLTSGTYIYKMETPEFVETKKMILLK